MLIAAGSLGKVSFGFEKSCSSTQANTETSEAREELGAGAPGIACRGGRRLTGAEGAAAAAAVGAAAACCVSTLICVEPEGTLMCSELCSLLLLVLLLALLTACDTTLLEEVDDIVENDPPPPPAMCTEDDAAEEAADPEEEPEKSPSVWHRLFCPGEYGVLTSLIWSVERSTDLTGLKEDRLSSVCMADAAAAVECACLLACNRELRRFRELRSRSPRLGVNGSLVHECVDGEGVMVGAGDESTMLHECAGEVQQHEDG